MYSNVNTRSLGRTYTLDTTTCFSKSHPPYGRGRQTAASAWSAGLPKPHSSAEGIAPETVAEFIKSDSKVNGKDYQIVDLRRTDFEDYAIPGVINLPAHSFYATRAGAVAALSHIPIIIFHCQSCGAPTSRGQRVAAYYKDALQEKGIATSKSTYLEGGIKGWVEKYQGDEALVIKL